MVRSNKTSITKKEFNNLKHRDFDNGAVLDEIAETIKAYEKLTSDNNDCTVTQSKIAPSKLKKLQEILHDYKNDVYGHETFSVTISELQSFFNFVQSQTLYERIAK